MEVTAPQDKEAQNRQSIIQTLISNPRGLTINDVAGNCSLSRETAVKHLQALELQNEVYTKHFGNVQVFYSNHRKLKDKDVIKLNWGNRTIFINLLENEYGEFAKISETRKVGEKWETKGSVLIPKEKLDEFVLALKDTSKRSKLLLERETLT
jgi:predicted transcriptional regulator